MPRNAHIVPRATTRLVTDGAAATSAVLVTTQDQVGQDVIHVEPELTQVLILR